MLTIEWAGMEVELLPDKALHLPASRTLVIADTHFGKPAAFRSAGIPVPAGTTRADLGRLDALLEATGAARLIVLGDFFHARPGCDRPTMAALEAWRRRRPELMILNVRGNHDIRAGDPPHDWNIACVDEGWSEGGLVFAHAPRAPRADGESSRRGHVLCGHLHPAISLCGRGGDALRAPCFWLTPGCGVLPAFGSFTGMRSVRPADGDRVFAVGPGDVVEVTPRPVPHLVPSARGGRSGASKAPGARAARLR